MSWGKMKKYNPVIQYKSPGVNKDPIPGFFTIVDGTVGSGGSWVLIVRDQEGNHYEVAMKDCLPFLVGREINGTLVAGKYSYNWGIK